MSWLLIILTFLSLNAFAVCDGTVESIAVPDPVNETTFNITSKVWRPAGTNFPVIFVLPPVVGETPLDSALALNFCLNGMAAYVVNLRNEPSDDEQVTNLNVHEDTLIRAEDAITRLIRNLRNDSAINGKFGMIGASLGGIITSYIAGINPDIQTSVIIAGGGNLAEILADSSQLDVSLLRVRRIQAFNLRTNDQYQDLLTPFITREPLIFAENIKNNFQYVLTLDTDVPTKNQRVLERAINNQVVREIENSHLEGIIEATTRHAGEITNWFTTHLK